MESLSPRLLACAHAIEEWRETSHVERPPRSQNHGNVNVLGPLDNSLVEHSPDLIRKTVVHSCLQLFGAVAGSLTDKFLREGTHPGDLFLRVAIVDSTVIDELP